MAVLVTRPDERGKALVDQLNQAGVVALHLPLLSIEAGAELAQLPTKLNQLLNLPQMTELTDKNLLILRGNGGRELLREQATLRGATVETIECYQRTPISYNNEEQTSICIRSGVQTLVVTSLEILQALIEFVPENEQNWLKNCCLVTVSQRIADVAVQQGWHNVVVSAGADNHSLLNTLLNEVTPLSH